MGWTEAGAMRVGPRSAGADPGPACYGRGGTEPTVTDANFLWAGSTNGVLPAAGWPLTSKLPAKPLPIWVTSWESASRNGAGDLDMVNAKMADAIPTVTIQRGIDPRNFSLVAFGGAGPMHAAALAEQP